MLFIVRVQEKLQHTAMSSTHVNACNMNVTCINMS
jgi:hypothetical protein